ncbi:MAG: STAS domain-containing protein [Fibrobacterota bacterium]
MGTEFRVKSGFDFVDFDSDLYFRDFPAFRIQINKIISKNPPKVVLNFLMVRLIDQGMLKVIKNLANKISENKGRLIFINVRKETLELLQAAGVGENITFYKDEEQFERETENATEKLLEYGRPGYKNYTAFSLKCDVCGFHPFEEQVLIEKNFQNKWKEDELLPSFNNTETGDKIHYYENLINVCPECYFASWQIESFSIIHGENFKKSNLDSDSQLLLSKTAGRRKKIIQNIYENDQLDLSVPRKDDKAYITYRLLLESLNALSFDHEKVRVFDLAKFNFVAAYFAPPEEEENLHKNGLEWCNKIINHPENFRNRQIMETHYYSFAVLLKQGKKKDAREAITALKLKQNTLCSTSEDKSYFSFWYDRMEYMWDVVVKSDRQNLI